MKFTSYDPVVNTGVMQNNPVHVSRDIHAYGPQGGGEMAGALANLAKVGLELQKKVTDGKVMEANAEYNKLMTEGTTQLMQRKEEAALNITEDYDKLQKNVLGQIKKKYGGYIGFGAGAEAFNTYTMRDDTTRRNHVFQYQVAETDKYHETQFNNQLAACQQMVMDGGATDAAIEEGYNRGIGLLQSRFANYGPEKLKEQERLFKGQLVSSALQTAINMGDYVRMGDIASKYNNYLDPKTRVSVLSMLGKRQREAHDLRQATNAFERFGFNATWEDIKNSVIEDMKGGGTGSFFKAANALCGVTMDNGRVGCVEYVVRTLNGITKFGTDNAAERNCGNLFRAASAEGSGMRVVNYTGQEIPAGAILFYRDDDDFGSDPEDIEHVTLADGNGGYFGNSSSAKDYEDENGNYIRGDGCGVHSDSQEIGGYRISHFAVPDDITASELSDLQIEEETNRRWALYQSQVSRVQTAYNQFIKQGTNEMKDLRNQGVLDEEAYQAIVDKYSYQDGEVKDYIRIPLESQMRSMLSVMQKAAEREARAASGRGGSGGSTDADPFYSREMISMIRTHGLSKEQAYELVARDNPKGAKEVLNDIDNYFDGKGKHSMDWDKLYKGDIKKYLGIRSDDAYFNRLFNEATDYAYEKIEQYRKEHGGSDPTDDQILGYLKEAVTKQEVVTGRGYWFGGEVKKESPLSPAEWNNRGVVSEDYDLTRGQHIIETRRGRFAVTQEQYDRIVAGENADAVIAEGRTGQIGVDEPQGGTSEELWPVEW